MIELTDCNGNPMWVNRAYVATVASSKWSDYTTEDKELGLPYTMREGSNTTMVGNSCWFQVREKPQAVMGMLMRVR